MGSLKGALINVSSLGVSFGHSRAFNPLYTELTSNWNMVFSDGLYRYVWHFLSINDVRLLFSFWKHLIHGVFTTTLGLFLNLYRRKKCFVTFRFPRRYLVTWGRRERKRETEIHTEREREKRNLIIIRWANMCPDECSNSASKNIGHGWNSKHVTQKNSYCSRNGAFIIAQLSSAAKYDRCSLNSSTPGS